MISGEPHITVGILSAPEIRFRLEGGYFIDKERAPMGSVETVTAANGQLLWNGKYYSQLCFVPENRDKVSFMLFGVTIGVQFHWERNETQSFRGELIFLLNSDGSIQAINRIPVEVYLKSVIASEMNGAASPAFLKAHAVISRSWLLAQLERKNRKQAAPLSASPKVDPENGRVIKWYDREEHALFDVCADDHCQRYQGITRTLSPQVLAAVEETRGQVLLYGGAVCDARFSKCCGGITEEYQNCWQDDPHPYMPAIVDRSAGGGAPILGEADAERFICSSPDAFCYAPAKEVLQQVLNNYDCETVDFYRWAVTHTQAELTALLLQKTGIYFGSIKKLIPLKRGTSGRIIELKVEGMLRSVIFGKELEIRRILSPSHLYSSAFVVKTVDADANGYPQKFILHGAGWGHGVGLCQIGAAVMGHEGYSFRQILQHYYPPATLEKLYE